MSFPLQSFGPHIDAIFGYATHLLDLLDDKRFLYVILIFYFVVSIARWAIGRLQHPPELG